MICPPVSELTRNVIADILLLLAGVCLGIPAGVFLSMLPERIFSRIEKLLGMRRDND